MQSLDFMFNKANKKEVKNKFVYTGKRTSFDPNANNGTGGQVAIPDTELEELYEELKTDNKEGNIKPGYDEEGNRNPDLDEEY